MHIASTFLLTFYRVSPKRGSLLENVSGIVVHDHWKPYYTLSGVLHALCNAHQLRELKALVEIEKEDWARRMQRLLRTACHVTTLAREADKPLKPAMTALIERRYDAIVARGLAFHEAQPELGKIGKRGRKPRRVGHNLLLRLLTRKPDVLRFLTDPSVPFTNNLAEQDARMMKVRQKISGGFRSEDGAKELRHDPVRPLHRKEAGVELARDPDDRSNQPDRPITIGGRCGGVAGLLPNPSYSPRPPSRFRQLDQRIDFAILCQRRFVQVRHEWKIPGNSEPRPARRVV